MTVDCNVTTNYIDELTLKHISISILYEKIETGVTISKQITI